MKHLIKEKKAEEIIKEVQRKTDEIEEGKLSPDEFIEEESPITADKLAKLKKKR